ncbi:MAG: helix-turn-helix domain-containing protein [Candidatus Omnitrophota bacterium]
MIDKKIAELSEQFENLTIKKMMKILTHKASNSKLYYKEIMEEFEKTLLLSLLEKYDYNKLKMATGVKLHRNTIAQKMEKMKIKEKKKGKEERKEG